MRGTGRVGQKVYPGQEEDTAVIKVETDHFNLGQICQSGQCFRMERIEESRDGAEAGTESGKESDTENDKKTIQGTVQKTIKKTMQGTVQKTIQRTAHCQGATDTV